MLWLEPLVEVATPQGRSATARSTAADVDGLVAAGMLDGADHPLRLGVVDELPWLATQKRVTFARVGVTDPLSADDYLRTAASPGCAPRWSIRPPTWSPRSPTPDCAAAAARDSRPASSGRPCSTAPTS